MILVHLGVNIAFGQKERQFTQLAPMLSCDFTLQCLLCGQTHQLSSPATYRIKEDEQPSYYIYQIKTVIQQNRSCENCGTLSTLPKLDGEELDKKLARIITTEFIKQHAHDEPPFMARELSDRTLKHARTS